MRIATAFEAAPRSRARRRAGGARAGCSVDRRCLRRGARRGARDPLRARRERGAGCRAPRAGAHAVRVERVRRFTRHRWLQHAHVRRIGRRDTGFGRRSGARASVVAVALRRRRGGERSVGTRADRASTHARAARARTDDRLHHRATTSTRRAVGQRGSVLTLPARARWLRTGSCARKVAAGDDRHIAFNGLLPAAQSGRVTGTSDRLDGHHARRLGSRSQYSIGATVSEDAT